MKVLKEKAVEIINNLSLSKDTVSVEDIKDKGCTEYSRENNGFWGGTSPCLEAWAVLKNGDLKEINSLRIYEDHGDTVSMSKDHLVKSQCNAEFFIVKHSESTTVHRMNSSSSCSYKEYFYIVKNEYTVPYDIRDKVARLGISLYGYLNILRESGDSKTIIDESGINGIHFKHKVLVPSYYYEMYFSEMNIKSCSPIYKHIFQDENKYVLYSRKQGVEFIKKFYEDKGVEIQPIQYFEY